MTNPCKTHIDYIYITGRSCHKYHFCRDKTSVTTNICRDKHNFVAEKVLSRQACFCRDKHAFVAINTCLLRQISVATQDAFCRDKHVFVATKMILAAAPAYGKGGARTSSNPAAMSQQAHIKRAAGLTTCPLQGTSSAAEAPGVGGVQARLPISRSDLNR